MHETFCPECEQRLKLSANTHKGQRVICPRCRTSLVVVSLEPFELELATLVNHLASSKKRSHMVEVPCPECDHIIQISVRVQEGEQVICLTCNTTLEVVDTDPVELDIAMSNLKWSRQSQVNRQRYSERKPNQSSRRKKR